MRKPKGMLFDLGDTILAQTSIDDKLGIAKLIELGNAKSTVDLKYALKLANFLQRETDIRREEAQIEFTRQCINRNLLDQLDLEPSLPPPEIELEYWKVSRKLEIEPNVEKILSFLYNSNIVLGIISNSTYSADTLMWELKQHNLVHFFRFVISSADYGFRKPHPFIFQSAIVKLGLSAEDIWYTGDSIKYDILGAKSFGLFSVWYNKNKVTSSNIKPDLEISNWIELLDILKS